MTARIPLRTNFDDRYFSDRYQVSYKTPSLPDSVCLSVAPCLPPSLSPSLSLPLSPACSLALCLLHTHKYAVCIHTRTLANARLTTVTLYSHSPQALPANGYTAFFTSLLQHPNITVALSTDFHDIEDAVRPKREGKRVPLFYTGPIDRYFKGAGLGKLEYRSLRFDYSIHHDVGLVQTASVVNQPSGLVVWCVVCRVCVPCMSV